MDHWIASDRPVASGDDQVGGVVERDLTPSAEPAEGFDQVALFEDAHVHEQLAQSTALLCLKRKSLLDLGVRHETAQDEHVAKLLADRAGCYVRNDGFCRGGHSN